MNVWIDNINNLKVFLERVDLKGNEVPAYVDIINSINQAELEAQKSKKEDEV